MCIQMIRFWLNAKCIFSSFPQILDIPSIFVWFSVSFINSIYPFRSNNWKRKINLEFLGLLFGITSHAVFTHLQSGKWNAILKQFRGKNAYNSTSRRFCRPTLKDYSQPFKYNKFELRMCESCKQIPSDKMELSRRAGISLEIINCISCLATTPTVTQ